MNEPEVINTDVIVEESQPTLADLLADTTTEKVETKDGVAPETDNAKPNDLKALAEKFAAEDKDLYEIAIPFANGESRTIGELKDIANKQDDFTVREMKFEESRETREADLMRAQDELRQLMSSLPPESIKPEMIEKVRVKHEATLQVERAATREAIPEWDDEETQKADVQGMMEHLKGYGIPETYLMSIYDHRILKYMRDNWLRQQRVEKALAQVTKGQPAKTKTSKATGKAPRKLATQTNSRKAGPNSQLADFLS